jgi:hypothetical protein
VVLNKPIDESRQNDKIFYYSKNQVFKEKWILEDIDETFYVYIYNKCSYSVYYSYNGTNKEVSIVEKNISIIILVILIALSSLLLFCLGYNIITIIILLISKKRMSKIEKQYIEQLELNRNVEENL